MSENIRTLGLTTGQELLVTVKRTTADVYEVEHALTLIPVPIQVLDDKRQPVINPATGEPETRTTLTFFKYGMAVTAKGTLTISRDLVVFDSDNIDERLLNMYQQATGQILTQSQKVVVA
jgi:hypothetical protein